MTHARGGDLADLYQEVILDHHRRPRNHGRLGPPATSAEGYNPLCGDRVQVWARVEGARLADVAFEGSGCAIATASASLMTEAVRGLPLTDVERLFRRFHALLTGGASGAGQAGPPPPALGKLEVLAGVREFPVRVKCATLAWHTLKAALAGATEPVSTE